MFINYFAHDTRPSGFNTAVARVLLGAYAVWKLLSYRLDRLQDWPEFLFLVHRHRFFLPFPGYLAYLPIEQWIAVFLLILFAIGWRIGFTAFTSALLIGHMIALHYAVTNSGATFLPAIYMLIFFAVFRETDDLSIDTVRGAKHEPLAALVADLAASARAPRDMAILKWTLVTIALTYFFTGYAKLLIGGLSWATGQNLATFIHSDSIMYLNGIPVVGRFLMDHAWLADASAVATVVLECGFLVGVLLGLPITPFILGLAGLHVMIALGMRIFFFDQFLLYLLFVPWDRLYARLAGTQPVTVVYDAGSELCARILLLFKHLDIHDSIAFRPAADLLAGGEPPRFGSTPRILLLRDGESYAGYHAFRELLRHCGIFAPLVWIMGWPPVARAGERACRRIAGRGVPGHGER